MNREDIELMAPVGSYESLYAAIQAGADSVYFGVGNMNMRARSTFNFTENDLEKIVRVCKYFGKRTYLTLNIVFFDSEITEMKRIIETARNRGIDAIIASDMAAIQYSNEAGMEVHASTQLNISNTDSLKFYAKYADVAVLARELNLEQIEKMAQQIEKQKITGPSGELIRIEIFAHGALCMSVSGKCYLSLHHHDHSANRGECLQDCRRAYIVTEKETGIELQIDNPHIMSPKDLYTIHFLDKIIGTGVKVLKIEGRARSPEYVRIVTECYNQALRSCAEGTYTPEKISLWKERLKTVYNRGFWEGYYLGGKMGEWNDSYGSKAVKRKIYTAKSMNYFTRIHVADFLCESGSLKVGDQVLITGPSTGVIEHVVHEIRVDHERVDEVSKGDRFSIPIQKKIRRSDRLYKLVDV